MNKTFPVVNEPDDDYDKPYKPVEKEKLPFKESDFPVAVRQLLGTAPAQRKVPVFLSTLCPLCAMATRVRIHYPYDVMPHALLLQTVIEAPPSTGKRCFSYIVEVLTESTLLAHDKRQRRIEQEYQERKRSRAQNEKIGPEPKTTIRCIPPFISKTVIVKRSDLYERVLGDTLTFWMWAEELKELGDAGRNAFSNLRTIMRIAYDLGSRYGQDFASENSYSGNADVCVCSMFCATPQDVDEIFNKKEVMGGGTSRVILIPFEDEAGAKPALFRKLTEGEQDLVQLAIDRLMQDTYTDEGLLQPVIELDTSWLDASVDRFTNDTSKRVLELKTAGQPYRSLDHFRKRGSVNGYRSASMMYYLYQIENQLAKEGAQGAVYRDEEQIRRLCIRIYRYLANYCVRSNNDRWGAIYEDGYRRIKEGAKVDQYKPLIEQLTTTFTREQLDELITQNCLDTEARFFLSQWKSKGWITKVRKNVYQKQL